MARTTSYTLDERLDAFVREQVASGASASASEVIRKALTHMAEQHEKEQALLAALDHGLASGRAKAGTVERVRQRVRARMQTKR
jgi:putative addiction module CopG family antidote